MVWAADGDILDTLAIKLARRGLGTQRSDENTAVEISRSVRTWGGALHPHEGARQHLLLSASVSHAHHRDIGTKKVAWGPKRDRAPHLYGGR